MAMRLPSFSASFAPQLDGFAICNSRGRRVSLLNDDDDSFALPFSIHQHVPPDYPLSPTQSYASEISDLSYNSAVRSNLSFSTSPSICASSPHLPPVNDMISFTVPNYDLPENMSRKSSISSLSGYSGRGSVVSAGSRRGSVASSSSKGSKRRYECATCGKSFTTSGHVSRHNRIHTGEKNFQCPEAGCSQRFSRQDNCMYMIRHLPWLMAGNTIELTRLTPWSELTLRNLRDHHPQVQPTETKENDQTTRRR